MRRGALRKAGTINRSMIQLLCTVSNNMKYEVFAGASGVVHASHCLTRDVAFFAGESQLGILGWHPADRSVALFGCGIFFIMRRAKIFNDHSLALDKGTNKKEA